MPTPKTILIIDDDDDLREASWMAGRTGKRLWPNYTSADPKHIGSKKNSQI